ncbi:hypothetical protein P5V62_16735 [Mycobacteroides abscessus subsp. massiliense]|uniref:hypothetical protein n=1 Tax=Mycobacteroides abscessus TaxID=36809 RepID=UPI0010568123|nr:hypothetical protein [Mycobacteroides abscessus]MDO2976025.1 hypothetical protein [Mycobacteroides abscessus subsp. massiliense]
MHIGEIRRLRDEVIALGGKCPKSLADLIDAHDLIAQSQGTVPLAGSEFGPVFDAAVAGKLTPKRLDDLTTAAAGERVRSQFRADLRNAFGSEIVRRTGILLVNGGADEIIDSLRPAFTAAAAVIEHSLSLVDLDQDYPEFVHSASVDQLEAIQKIDAASIVTGDILALVANKFGPRSHLFPLIEKPVDLGTYDEFKGIRNEAIWTTDPAGGVSALLGESSWYAQREAAVYSQRTIQPQNMGMRGKFGAHVFRGLRLNSVVEARELVRLFAETVVDKWTRPEDMTPNPFKKSVTAPVDDGVRVEVLVDDTVVGVI